MNWYSYVGNNPVNNTDPTGLAYNIGGTIVKTITPEGHGGVEYASMRDLIAAYGGELSSEMTTSGGNSYYSGSAGLIEFQFFVMEHNKSTKRLSLLGRYNNWSSANIHKSEFYTENNTNYISVEYFCKLMCEMGFPKKVEKVSGHQAITKLRSGLSGKIGNAKLEAMCMVGQGLLDAGYPVSFVAGMLANIQAEDSVGIFESSYYPSYEALPNYLKFMEDNHNYREAYSDGIITEKSLSVLKTLLDELEGNNWQKGKFGLGSVQWTGNRTMDLVNLYIEEASGNDRITMDQALVAECRLMLQELTGSYRYVYTNWLEKNKNNSSSELAAENAASYICLEYVRPKNPETKAKERETLAKDIYKIMIG